jgi:DNA-binding MarR family transcriptional regulator
MGKLAQMVQRLALEGETANFDARHIGILMLAAADRSLTQQSIGEQLGIDRTTMVRLAGELEAGGYAARVRRPEDRRAIQILPTASGMKLVRRMDARIRRAEDRVLATLAAADRTAFERIVNVLFAAWVRTNDDA